MKYQDYLEGVVQNMSKFFPEISDILNRYKTLRDANIYLLEKQQADEALNEFTMREFVAYKKSKENEILNDNNEIAGMQLNMEQRLARTNALQEEIDSAITAASEEMLVLGQIVRSVSNILHRCEDNFRKRHNKPPIDRPTDRLENINNPEQLAITVRTTISKLEDIKMFLSDLESIKEEYMKLRSSGLYMDYIVDTILPPIQKGGAAAG